MNESNGLPKGWAKARLADLITPGRERVLPADNHHLPFVGLEHVEAHTMCLLGTAPSSTMRSSSVHFFPGDVLYGRLRPYLNKVANPDFEGLCSAEFIVFPASPCFDNTFLQYRLNASDFVSFASHLDEGDRPRVDFTQIGAFEIKLPSVGEQRRIVAKIEELFSDLDAGVAALKRVKANLKRYRASVLKAAVEGHLTAEWRATHPPKETAAQLLQRILKERRNKWEESLLAAYAKAGKSPPTNWKDRYKEPATPDQNSLPELPKGWCWASVQQVGKVQLGRQRSPQHHLGPHMRPYLRVANVFEDRIDISDVMEMNFTPEEYEVYCLHYGDILLNEGQSKELIGRPAVYRDEVPGACFTNTLVRFQSSCALDNEYAFAVFLTYLKNGRFQKIATITVNIAHLGAGRFAELEFPLPSLEEQRQIVLEVNRHLSIIQAIELQIEANLKRSSRLRQSILKRAFEGKLVPQDPKDEPAEGLIHKTK